MKNIFKYAYSALMGVAALTAVSCSDSYEYDGRGEWNATDGYANIYFPVTSQAVELDPADPTTATIQVKRRNTSNALTVPFEVTKNTDNVFTVGTATFAAGDSVANIEISFPNAKVGEPYTLQLTLNDPSLVSSYSEDIIYNYEVTRVKWNDVGFYYDAAGNKVEGWAMYTEDFITGIYSVENVSYPVRVQERDDQEGVFRIINAYDGKYPYNDPGDWDDTQDYYIIIDASDPTKVKVTPSDFELGLVWSYGSFILRWYGGGLNASGGKISDVSPYYGTYANGAITFPPQSFVIGMSEYNGGGYRWYANANGKFKLVLNPDLDLYTATPEDYDWEPVFEGQYVSEQLDTTTDGVVLYRGVHQAEPEKADSGAYARFEAEYGTPYLVASPYASGHHLVFGVKEDGTVTTPYEIQDLGIEAVGSEVYGRIRGGGSTFSAREVVLRIVFQNEDGSIEYGTADEMLAYIVWNKVGTGTYTYNTLFFCQKDEEGNPIPIEDPGYEVFQREDKEDTYKLADWGEGVDFIFTWDKETNQCTIPQQFSGYIDADYGTCYFGDYAYWQGDARYYENYPCYYDPESSTFVFNIAYYVEAGSFGRGTETLVVEWDAAQARSKAVANKRNIKKAANLKLDTSKKMPNRWVGKKVNKMNRLVVSKEVL